MQFKTVISSEVPILKEFKTCDGFQQIPFFYPGAVPMSKFAKHFPVF